MWTPLSATPDRTRALPQADDDLTSRIARASTIARAEPRISGKAIAIILAVFAAVGITAGLVENYMNAHVVGPPLGKPSAAVASTLPTIPSALPGAGRGGFARLMGLTSVHGVAPGFRLVDGAGRSLSLSSLRGKAVVVSFFDAPCDDICPVLAAELRAADRDLGPKAASVALLSVDADPLSTGSQAAAEGAARSGLGGSKGLSNWHFLSGPLPVLDAVWKHYGMTIQVDRATRQVSHNDTLWFLTPSGRLAYEATPFADEHRRSGTYRLPAATEARFGAGIARVARILLAHAPARP